MNKKKLVVIGGGAAGFFCAVNAARMNPGLQVTILEKSTKLLSKVRVSGGGRCNVTHALFDIVEMSKRYPRGQNFVKKNFHQFFTTDTINWFEERGVRLKPEKDGRMFPVTDSSQTIIDCLMLEAKKFGVEIRMNAEVKGVAVDNPEFAINLSDNERLSASYLVLATGGYPKLPCLIG
jgi:predicted Rossmann fold flavoprotein